MQEFFKVSKIIFIMAIAAGVISFVAAMSFWWGTYFSISMVLDLISQVFK